MTGRPPRHRFHRHDPEILGAGKNECPAAGKHVFELREGGSAQKRYAGPGEPLQRRHLRSFADYDQLAVHTCERAHGQVDPLVADQLAGDEIVVARAAHGREIIDAHRRLSTVARRR